MCLSFYEATLKSELPKAIIKSKLLYKATLESRKERW